MKITNKLAQIKLYDDNQLEGFGTLGQPGSNAPGIFGKFINSTIGLMTAIAFIWFIFILITGAYGWMTAGGDKGAAEKARSRITSGLIGLVVVIAAIFIVRLIAYLLGIEEILDPTQFISELEI